MQQLPVFPDQHQRHQPPLPQSCRMYFVYYIGMLVGQVAQVQHPPEIHVLIEWSAVGRIL